MAVYLCVRSREITKIIAQRARNKNLTVRSWLIIKHDVVLGLLKYEVTPPS